MGLSITERSVQMTVLCHIPVLVNAVPDRHYSACCKAALKDYTEKQDMEVNPLASLILFSVDKHQQNQEVTPKHQQIEERT